MNRRKFVFSTTVALGIAVCAPSLLLGESREKWHLSQEFLDALPGLMDKALVPGLAIALVEDGSVVSVKTAGVMNRESKQPIDEETVFEAASLSKPMFAYTVLRLTDSGLIDLDRPLDSYLASSSVSADDKAKQITARHVLSHSSGFMNWRFNEGAELSVTFPPGSQFSYSGEGYIYLQRVVEEITGRGLESVMREYLFEPLGLKKSSYVWSEARESDMARGYRKPHESTEGDSWGVASGKKRLALSREWQKPLDTWRYADMVKAHPHIYEQFPPFPTFFSPNVAGSLFTTAGEYARFMMLFMAQPNGGEIAKKLELAPTTRDDMLTAQVNINESLGWGLGWGVETVGDTKYFWHWGDNVHFKNLVIGDPTRGRALVILTTSTTGNRLWEPIVSHVTGEEHPLLKWVE